MNEWGAAITKCIEMKLSLSIAHLPPILCSKCTVTLTGVHMCHDLSCLCAFGPESPLPEFLSSLSHHHFHPLYESDSSSSRKLSLIPHTFCRAPNALRVCWCLSISSPFFARTPLLWTLKTLWDILLNKVWIKNHMQTNHSVSWRWKKTAVY